MKTVILGSGEALQHIPSNKDLPNQGGKPLQTLSTFIHDSNGLFEAQPGENKLKQERMWTAHNCVGGVKDAIPSPGEYLADSLDNDRMNKSDYYLLEMYTHTVQ